ncbi:hypothetical protein ACFWBF_31655 [Streptomyces sp. NPDC060028]|uniref:hypothetical protein n=1 Tax=Streptomyces sp. NPDC060028 TaxID=3347041 RepID=UPI00368BFFCF
MDAHPWETYTRSPLRAGFAYPVGQTAVEAELRAAGLHVEWLHLSGAEPKHWAEWGPLVHAYWYANSRPKCGGRAGLSLSSVPSGQRTLVRELLLEGLLQQACQWLTLSARHPGSGWATTSRNWRAGLRDGEVTITQW